MLVSIAKRGGTYSGKELRILPALAHGRGLRSTGVACALRVCRREGVPPFRSSVTR
jgi:hypothetical protein